MRALTPNPPDRYALRGCLAAGVAALAVSLFVLAGRFGGHPEWTRILRQGPPMAFTTASAFFFCGLSLVFTATHRRRLAQVAAVCTGLFGLATLVALILAQPMGWTSFIYDPEHPIVAAGVGIDGRMSPNTCVAFLLTSLCLFSIAREKWQPLRIATLASIVLGISSISLLSFATGLNASAAWTRYVAMAVHTAGAFLVVSSALLVWVSRRTAAGDRNLVRAFPLFTLAALTFALLAVIVASINDERQMSSVLVRRSMEIRSGIERFIAATARADAAVRNFQLSGDDYYVGRVAAHRAAILEAVDDIERLDPKNPALGRKLKTLRELSTQNFVVKDGQMAVRRGAGGLEAAARILRQEPPEIIQGLRTTTDSLYAEESRILALNDISLAVKERQMRWALLACAVLGITLVSVAFSRMFRAKQKLRRSHALLEERTAEATAGYERLQTIADNLPVLVAYVDRNLRYQFANKTYENWLQVDYRNLIGKEIWTVLGDAARGPFQPVLDQVFSGERATYARSINLPGGERFLLGEYIPDLSASGEVRGFYMVATDLTARHAIEEQMERARDEAQTASKLKSDFMASMSHEIRTPLNGVVGITAHLMENAAAPEQREMLQVLDDSARTLLGIINDILDFARLEAGKLTLDAVDFELSSLLTATLAPLQQFAKKKALILSLELDERINRTLRGDPRRLRQVLTNLASNALKFTESGRVLVSARALTCTEAFVTIRFAVRDTGPGIAKTAQARLFKPFVQLEALPEKNQNGTGLGLAISRELVGMMNGSVGVESEPGQGAEFWFVVDLPWSVTDTETRRAARKIRGHMLVVDDDVNDRLLTAGELERAGFQVTAVGDAEAALALLRSPPEGGQRWDLVLTDQKMPRMGGLELARAMRKDPSLSDTPLVLMSGGAVIDPQTVSQVGFEAFLNKPVNAEQVLRVLERLALHPTRGLAKELGGTAPASAPPSHSPEAPKLLRLLVADDNEANRYVARMILSRLKVSLEFATNGSEALEKLAQGGYDGVLMDCQMPVMSGYEATRRIRDGEIPGVPVQLPVIAMTAFAMPGDAEKCFAAGMSGYLSKPIRLATLVEELRRAGLPVPDPTPPFSRPATDPPSEAVLDRKHMKEMQAIPGQDGRTVWDDLVVAFTGSVDARLAALESLAGTGDAAQLGSEAHRFAGSCAGVGATELKLLALELQRRAERNDWRAAKATLAELRSAQLRFESALRPESPEPIA
jgi:PAS domain S-box-containing protein